ncbi:MAG: hypothetical protein JW809_06060 [Pirellulales bacterium]|nr:hypothetical protein [Pirellulales bacterium]
MAAAFWKAAAAALTTVAVLAILAMTLGFQPNMDDFAATMLTLLGGVVVNTLLGLGAMVAALAFRLRVWVHPRLLAMTHGSLSAIAVLTPRQSGFNHAVFVVATALVFPVLVMGAVVYGALTVGKDPDKINSVPILITGLGMLVVGPIAMIPCYAWVSSRIIARAPQDCWPDMVLRRR